MKAIAATGANADGKERAGGERNRKMADTRLFSRRLFS